MKSLAPTLPAGVRRSAVAGVALALVSFAPAVAQDGTTQAFDIPAQEARTALVRLCVVADCEVVLMAATGHSARTRPVRGRMSWRTAVDQMLKGTVLRYRFVGERGLQVWIQPERPAPRPSMPVETTELEPVMVVGRLSDQIDESLRRKRHADVISDSASATRIGELPAANLAEALQRVPGVAVEREVGEGQFVSVRGLGPLFQSVTLNGAPVAFNENIRNSTQSGRQFRFRALSADLLAGAQVTKSATPDLIEGGIGSNIDIETIGGLGGDPFLSLRLGGATDARTAEVRPDVSIAGRIVSAQGDWGLVGGVSQEARSVLYDRFQIQRYRPVIVNGRTVAAPSDVRTTLEQEDRRRRSLFVGGEWIASQTVRLTFDGLISTFDNAIREDRLVYGLGERVMQSGAQTTVRNEVVVGASVVDGQIDNNTEFSDQAHWNAVFSAGAEWLVGDWTLKPRISVSSARSRLNTPLSRISFNSAGGVRYAVDVDGAVAARRVPQLATDFDVRNPSLLKFQRFAVRAIESVDDDRTALIDARHTMDVRVVGLRLSALQIGAQASDRARDYERRDREAVLRSEWPITPDFHGHHTHEGVFNDLVRRHPGTWSTADFDRFRDAFVIPGEIDSIIVRPDDLMPTGADLQNGYRVGERVAAAYVRADFDGVSGGAPITGNLGLRLVETRTQVEGVIMEADAVDRLSIRARSHEQTRSVLLPSVNVAIDLTPQHRLRLAASRTMTRPSLADLRLSTVPASTLVSSIYDRGQAEIDDPSPGTIFSGVGGNPALRPYVSTNYDASYEWSFPQGGVSLAAFYKQIDDFIGMVAASETLVFETRAGPSVRAQVLMSRPGNIGRAMTQGLEFGLHRRLPSGFGLWASAIWVDSHGPQGQARIPGVSSLSYSINPFFERGALSAGLSWNWRSAFRSEADMQGGGVSDFTVAPAGYLDAQIAFDIHAHAQLVLTASNLTDTTDLAYEGTRDRLLQLGRSGRAFTMSLRWRL